MVASPPAAPVRRGLAVAVVGAVLAGLVGWWAGPVPVTPGPATSGDPALAQRLREAAGPGQYGLAAALVQRGGTVYAAVGGDGRGRPLTADTPMEIGSIAKTMTGAVLAELERRGVVRAEERLRDVVPDRSWGPVGDVTLAELASHRSGLPVQPADWRTYLDGSMNTLFGTAPDALTVPELFEAADAASLGPRGESVYSNLGTAVLGQALAVRTGTPYPELLHEIVTGPLGMTATGVPDRRPPGAAVGHDAAGAPQEPWIGGANRPAGFGMYSTVTDLVRYVDALDDPASPVAAAAVPRYPSDFGRIGYGWYTLEVGGHTLLWKNGGSGGMSSSLLVEPATGRAAVVLGNTDTGVDRVAAELLGVPSPFEARTGSGSGGGFAAVVPVLLATVFPLLAGLTMLGAARGGWGRRPGATSRADLLSAAGSAVFFLGLARVAGAIDATYLALWFLGCVLTGAGAGLAALRWADAPWGAPGRVVNAAGSLLLPGALLVGVLVL